MNEVKILQGLDHPNIIKLYEIWDWMEVCFLVLEYCAGGFAERYLGVAQFVYRKPEALTRPILGEIAVPRSWAQ